MINLNKTSDEAKKQLQEKLTMIMNNKNDEIVSTLMDAVVAFEHEYRNTNKEPQVPNDKVILSATVFSKLVNIISFAENNELIDKGLLKEMVDDVSANRTSIKNNPKKNIKDIRLDSDNQHLKNVIEQLFGPHSTFDSNNDFHW